MIAHGVYNAVVLLVVRFSTGEVDTEITAAPLLFGAVLIAAGATVLWQQRAAHLREA
jgi:hypothetical protein